MLRLMYKTLIGQYKYSGETDVISGQVATFCGDRETKICDGISHPVGFFCQDYSKNDMIFTSHPSIIMGQSELITDVFEPSAYKVGDFLYCSKNGKITSELRYRGNIIIGIVNYVSSAEIGFITLFARNIEDPL